MVSFSPVYVLEVFSFVEVRDSWSHSPWCLFLPYIKCLLATFQVTLVDIFKVT